MSQVGLSNGFSWKGCCLHICSIHTLLFQQPVKQSSVLILKLLVIKGLRTVCIVLIFQSLFSWSNFKFDMSASLKYYPFPLFFWRSFSAATEWTFSLAYSCLPVILSQFTKGKIKQYLVAVVWFCIILTKPIHVGFPLFFWCVRVSSCQLCWISTSASTALRERVVKDCFSGAQNIPKRSGTERKKEKTKFEFPGMELLET